MYYLRRYISFLQQLLSTESESITLSSEVCIWLADTAAALSKVRPLLGKTPISADQRYQSLVELGEAASRYREAIYRQESFTAQVTQSLDQIRDLLDDAQAAVDHSISNNRRKDGLYHSYNLLRLGQGTVEMDTLYPMLEGQVAALSAGAISPQQVVSVLEALFDSDVYRADQHSFMLYPDRPLPGFLEKNQISYEQIEAIPLLQNMLADADQSIVLQDADGCYRFNAELSNIGELNAELDTLSAVYGEALEAAREPLQTLYEKVFNHQAFTGRSGGMFGFEGLGCIYWHMVSKLLLAIEENFFAALDQGVDEITCKQLGRLYYRVRIGIGFNKTPAEYGAFPTDPYSHTPKHAGAQQPGMTGQVKEEVLSRFGELGVRVKNGAVHFQPDLLRAREFVSQPKKFRYLDVDGNWLVLTVPAGALAFTWCQVPILYRLDDENETSLTITWEDGKQKTLAELALPAEDSAALFQRNGRIRQLTLVLATKQLFYE
jgi:hypothetical protein